MRYFLSLGTNLGYRENNLAQAVLLLGKAGVKLLNTSFVYETEPVDFPSQSWFFNQVIEIYTRRLPEGLLTLIKNIEINMGRKPSISKYSRIIDIDILFAEDKIIQTENLRIPHPKLTLRNFVLIPLNEICPSLIHPVFNEQIHCLLQKSKDRSVVRRIQNSKEF